jgi:UDP-N-acetylmuramoyl-tripeptide--D-alanyl-D-alanine ligase
MRHEGVTVAVLGEMKELGAYHREGHIQVGRAAAEMGIDYLISVGPEANLIAEGALEGGMEPSRIKACLTEDQAVSSLEAFLTSGVWVLFKGSRAAGIERIMEAFFQEGVSTNSGGV